VRQIWRTRSFLGDFQRLCGPQAVQQNGFCPSGLQRLEKARDRDKADASLLGDSRKTLTGDATDEPGADF
jgi:hypothetical protein